ncbi:MAG: hypothetical protein ACP5GJ_02635 [Nanopusillaceae archaeon]
MVSILDRISAKETLVLFVASAFTVFLVAAIISMFGVSSTLGFILLALSGVALGFVLSRYAPQIAAYLKSQPLTAILAVSALLGVSGFVAVFLAFIPTPYAATGTITLSAAAIQSALGTGINNFITMSLSGFIMGVGSYFGVSVFGK